MALPIVLPPVLATPASAHGRPSGEGSRSWSSPCAPGPEALCTAHGPAVESQLPATEGRHAEILRLLMLEDTAGPDTREAAPGTHTP